MKIYITKNVGEITFKRLRAIGLGYDVELVEEYNRQPEMFFSLVKSERHTQAKLAFGLCLRALRLFEQLQNENEILNLQL